MAPGQTSGCGSSSAGWRPGSNASSSAQFSFDATANLILATGTFPAAGYTGWLQIESETDAARTYVLYFEAPDAAVAGTAETFSLEELYEGRDAQSIDVLDSTGVHHLR